MNCILAVALGTVRGWTRIYTAGLPTYLRENRRAEIASDLWEHQRLAEREGSNDVQMAIEMLLRLVMGIHADVAWRLECGARARLEKGSRPMHVITIQKSVAVTAGLLILMAFGLAASNFWSVEGTTVEPLGRFWAGMLGVVPAVLMMVGLLLSGRAPRAGGLILFLGAISFAVLMWWTIIIPLTAVLLAVLWFRHPSESGHSTT